MGITESKFDYLDDLDSNLAEQTDNESSVHSDVEILNIDDEASTDDEQPTSINNQTAEIEPAQTAQPEPIQITQPEPAQPESTQLESIQNTQPEPTHSYPISIPQSTGTVEDLFDIAATKYNPRAALECTHQRIDHLMMFISFACMALLLLIFFYEANGHIHYKKEYEACELERSVFSSFGH